MTIYQDLIGVDGTVCGADFSRLVGLVNQSGESLQSASFTAFYFTLRKKWAPPGATDLDADVIAQVSLGAGITTSGTSGLLVTVPGALLVVPAKVYVYDLKALEVLGGLHVLVRGNFEVLRRAGTRSS